MQLKLLFLVVMFSVIGVKFVYADVPTVTEIEILKDVSGTIMKVTIRHGRPSQIHYIGLVEVKIGDEVTSFDLTPQETEYFTEIFEIPDTDEVVVRAMCTQHGWSQWAIKSISSEDSTTDEVSSTGIPGFSLFLMGLGLLLALWARTRFP